MSFKRAQFDLEKGQERIQTERTQYRERVEHLENDSMTKQTRLDEL